MVFSSDDCLHAVSCKVLEDRIWELEELEFQSM